MYAIVEIAGQQFKVEKGQKIFVHRLEAEVGSDVEFDKVLLIEDGDKITIGEPVIADFIVGGHVLSHLKGDKVIVFKKKRRKGYQKLNGHRQQFTQVEIVNIAPKGTPKKAAKKAEPEVKEVVAAIEVAEPVKEKKAAPSKKTVKAKAAPAEKESAEKKPAATKKPAAKKTAKNKEE
jgi:large subunit ribosomal protein L21